MDISKWFFKDLRTNIRNLYFWRQIPFLSFSDISQNNYDIISKVLNKINLDKNLLISFGKTQAPFGITVYFEDDKSINDLLNSCKYTFVMTDKISETNYLLQTVLAGSIPICNLNHVFIKKLGLKTFATLNDYENILDKLSYIKYHQKIFDYRISLLSWKYRNQWKKWNKEK